MKRVLLALPLIIFLSSGQAQIAIMNFDGTGPEWSFTNDVTFFDNNSDGFYGIHDANNNPNDGNPTDTGDGNPTDVAHINYSGITDDFLFVHDLEDEGDNGTSGFASLTFASIDISGFVDVVVSFDYDVYQFDNGDDVQYTMVYDGVNQTTVLLVDGSSNLSVEGTETINIPESVNNVGIIISVKQNGAGDQAGFDNIQLDGNIILPISLTSFTAKPTNSNSVSLNWSTESEENNKYFSIEHSTDGRDFAEIEKVMGAGTTYAAQHYQFTHEEAHKGSNYYRLRQVDYDETFSFSDIEVVVLKDQNEISVHPTLAQQEIVIGFNERLDHEGTIEIVNWLGQVVLTDHFSANTDGITLNVNGLEKGHYIIRVQTENGIQSSRFIKL